MSTSGLIDVAAEVAPDLGLEVRGQALEIRLDGYSGERRIRSRSSLTPSSASRLVGDDNEPGLVIADLIDSTAEQTLRAAGWSYWDRRGRLRLWLPEIGVRLDVPTRSYVTGADGPDPRRPVVGVGGISFALGILQSPDDPAGVREIARLAGMAASTISRARRHLMQVALVDAEGSPVTPELFWATSDAWIVKPISVDTAPAGDGWVLGGDAAAAEWGAPILGTNRRYYCSDRALFDRHRLRYGSDDSPVQIAMAPTPVAIASAVNGLVHPVVAALDLSRSARGREILGDWQAVDSEAETFKVVWE